MSVSLPDFSNMRAWQAEAIKKYLEVPERRDFTVTATPGAGKTNFALRLVKHLYSQKIIDRIIIVVPTDHLRTQWAESAHRLGLRLDSTLGNDAMLKKEFQGYVTTYAQVAGHPLLHERRTEAPHRTFVVFDEIHHAGDGLSWGDAIREAFTPAVRRLALTGTPFRTSAVERIPFVTYEDDSDGTKSVADYSYTYTEALNSSVVRPVLFAAYTGVARWSTNAGEVMANLTDELNQEEEFQAWKTILDPKGEWVPHVLAAAAARLEEKRAAGMPDAAMLVLASDQETAKAYAKVLENVTGVKPTLALSEDPKASQKISAFSGNYEKYLVAVRMVSEGVDIPRCAVLVWLTSYRTPLFFAQAVGRVVRARRAGESATVFLPAVRPLLALAAELEKSRDHVLAPKVVKDDEGMLEVEIEAREPSGDLGNEYKALASQAQFAHVVFSGRSVTAEPETGPLSDEESDYLGLFGEPGLLSPEQTAAMLAGRDKDLRLRSKMVTKGNDDESFAEKQVALHEKLAALRKEISLLVNRFATRTGKLHSEIHIMVRRNVPGPATAEANIDILTRRRDWLLSRLH